MSEHTSDESQTETPRESLGEIVRTIVYALLIALVFRTVLFQPFSIPSGSMKPTLLIGDYLFVSKYSYGYSKYSLPWGHHLPDSMFGGRLFGADPERGDVVVFRNPKDENMDYIKRVIGLPGDRVRVRRGVVYINGEPVSLERQPSFIEERDRRPGLHQACIRGDLLARFGVPPEDRRRLREAGPDYCLKAAFTETLPNGVSHSILDANGPDAALDNTPTFTVPDGQYFFMGDNRDNSADSRDNRSGIGFVPAQNLIGRAEIVMFSSEGSFWEVWTWRAARLLKWVD